MAIGFDMDPDDISMLIEGAVDSFDFTVVGEKGQSLGRDMVVAVADGIASRSNQGLDADGNPFRPNAKEWAEYKMKRYNVDRPGELGGQMLSLLSCVGKPEVSPDEIKMVYGLGEPPQRITARNGVPLKPDELKPTDREKADWYTAGGRRFYEIDQPTAERVQELAGERFLQHLDDLGLT